MFKITMTIFFLILYTMLLPITTTTYRPKVNEIDGEKEFIDTCSKIDYFEYCKKIGVCEAGSHVFCLYYKPNNVSKLMGPSCKNAQMVSLSQENINYILHRLNGIRANVANGKAEGTQGVRLPRGYGMMKLSWDLELVTFAQLWANQCRFERKYHCVATKRFPHVAEIQLMHRFTHPDWQQTEVQEKPPTKNCFTVAKVKESLQESLRFAISSDQYTEISHIQDPTERDLFFKKYLVLVHSKSTHIGCATSTYQSYYKKKHFNGVHTVCYLSSMPQPHNPVYQLKPEGNATENCGCPLPDYKEDANCLCVLASRTKHNVSTTSTTTSTTTSGTEVPTTDRVTTEGIENYKENPQQKQPVVVLPILKYEDASPERMMNLELRSNLTSKTNLKKHSKTARPKKTKPSGMAKLNWNSQNFITSPRRNNDGNDTVLINDDLRHILYNVPAKYRSGLEEMFLEYILEYGSKSVTNEDALLRHVNNYYISNQADEVAPNNNHIIGTDSDWPEHSRRTGNFIESTEIDRYRNKENIHSQLVMPIIRNQKPLVNGKDNSKYSAYYNNEKIFIKNDEPQKNDYYNTAQNDIISVNDEITLINRGKNRAHKKPKYIEESYISNQNPGAVEDKLKRRVYLNNEIRQMKNKLKHFRHLRRKDVNKNAPHSERKNTKLEDMNNFYMPDRAHSLHDF